MRKLIFWSLFFACPAYAGTCTYDLAIFYSNGVNNTYDEAEDSLNQFINKIGTKIFKKYGNKKLASHVAYNYSASLSNDLAEAYFQKEGERYEKYWDWYFSKKEPPAWWKKIYEKYSMDKDYINELNHKNIKSNVDFYNAYLKSNYKILTVAHSQGNLFFNQAYSVLSSKKDVSSEVKTIAVATPANRVANGVHVTLNEDKVIQWVSRVYETLPPNVSNGTGDCDWFQHNFIKSYLNGTNAGPEIANESIGLINELFSEEQSSKETTGECYEWFKKQDITTDDPEECVIECSTGSVNMGNFNCPIGCHRFCGCTVPQKGPFDF
ncbi:MAG: hypothetical protein IT215_05940 [Chitinophagaceae bacterium]|nr:hypothetical protein [Chitinophagaceae bacterium]